MTADTIEQMRPVRRRGGIVTWDGPRPVEDVEILRKELDGRKPTELLYRWCDEDILDAHKAYNRGDRSPWAREGERVYTRSRRRKQRAQAWLDWAERDAIAASWANSVIYYTPTETKAAA